MRLSKAIRLAEENDACDEELNKLKELLKSGVTEVEELVNHKLAPYWAYWYAKNVIKGPWPKGEDVISQNCEWSFDYAKYVIKVPFPKGEKVISQDAEYSYYYAKNVIKGPWPKGEDAISKNALLSYYYAKNVIKGPWPKGEDAISQDDYWSSRYNDYKKGKV
jgi:lambda repressor-like predicted transcriptional regulator